MKTPDKKILLAALGGITLSLTAFAGPGFQYWKNHEATATTASRTITAAPTTPMPCSTMTVHRPRVTRETSTTAVVTCTPDMRQHNAQCRQACGM